MAGEKEAITTSRGSGTTLGVRTKGLQRMLRSARGGGKWGCADEQSEGATELSESGRLRRPLRPPPISLLFPRRPQPCTRRPLRPVLASQL